MTDKSGETSSSKHRLPQAYAEHEGFPSSVPTTQFRPPNLGEKQVGPRATKKTDTRPKTSRSRNVSTPRRSRNR
jgi:hypothetical protein